MAYPTRSTIVGMSQVAALTSLQAAQQDVYYNRAIRAVESYCGQSFDSITETRVLDGQDGRFFRLPDRLYSLTSLAVVGSSLSTGDVLISDDHRRLEVNPSLVPGYGSGYYARALTDFDWEPLKFVYGGGNTTVDGEWGWDTAEWTTGRWARQLGGVLDALLFEMEDQAQADAHQLSPALQAYRQLGVDQISQGALRVQPGAVPRLSPRAVAVIPPELVLEGSGWMT